MKIFLSWSGGRSHKAAEIFRNWLPSVLQYVEPFLSSSDIEKGANWGETLFGSLKNTSFAIVFLEKTNFNEPWIVFEAGAVSNAIDKAKVAPILFNLKQAEVVGPLSQFQLTLFQKEEIRKLIISINVAAGDERLEPSLVDRVFEKWWSELEQEIGKINFEEIENHLNEDTKEKIFEEIAVNIRSISRAISDPTQILPIEYFRHLMDEIREEGSLPKDHPVWFDVEKMLTKISSLLKENEPAYTDEIFETVEKIRSAVDYIQSHLYERPRRRRGRPSGLRGVTAQQD